MLDKQDVIHALNAKAGELRDEAFGGKQDEKNNQPLQQKQQQALDLAEQLEEQANLLDQQELVFRSYEEEHNYYQQQMNAINVEHNHEPIVKQSDTETAHMKDVFQYDNRGAQDMEVLQALYDSGQISKEELYGANKPEEVQADSQQNQSTEVDIG